MPKKNKISNSIRAKDSAQFIDYCIAYELMCIELGFSKEQIQKKMIMFSKYVMFDIGLDRLYEKLPKLRLRDIEKLMREITIEYYHKYQTKPKLLLYPTVSFKIALVVLTYQVYHKNLINIEDVVDNLDDLDIKHIYDKPIDEIIDVLCGMKKNDNTSYLDILSMKNESIGVIKRKGISLNG